MHVSKEERGEGCQERKGHAMGLWACLGVPEACSAMVPPPKGRRRAGPAQDPGLKCKAGLVIPLQSKWVIQQRLGREPLKHLGKHGTSTLETDVYGLAEASGCNTQQPAASSLNSLVSDSRPTRVRTYKRQDGETGRKPRAPVNRGAEPASRCPRSSGETGVGLHRPSAGRWQEAPASNPSPPWPEHQQEGQGGRCQEGLSLYLCLSFSRTVWLLQASPGLILRMSLAFALSKKKPVWLFPT